MSFEDSLTLLLLLDLLVNLGDLVTSPADLLDFIAWIENHVFAEALLQTLLLLHELLRLLLILLQAVVEGVDLGLVLHPNLIYGSVDLALHTSVYSTSIHTRTTIT